MILRGRDLPLQRIEGSVPRQEQRFAEAAGLTHLAANICTLMPGERSAMRHWHENEDEFVYVIEGAGVLVENDGAHDIGPGDICCWPAGVDNAHHILNRSDAPLRYLVAGSDPQVDHVYYPDDGQTLHHVPPRWWVEDAEGRVLREGPTG